MEPSAIKQLLDAAFPDCDVSVAGEGGKYAVTAIGPDFEGLNAVKRQQAVYAVLNPHIASGAIHAITMRLQTQSEFDAS